MITLTDNRGKQVVDVSVGHTILVDSDMMTMIKLVRVRVGVTRLVLLTSPVSLSPLCSYQALGHRYLYGHPTVVSLQPRDNVDNYLYL